MATDSGGNQQVDFVWGNMPMQPDTGRTSGETWVAGTVPATTGANAGWIVDVSQAGVVLDGTLDSHNIAKYSYNGYPGYSPDSGVVVPNIVGDTFAAASTALQVVGLVLGANTGTGTTVLTQTPAAGANAVLGSSVTTTS